MATHRRSKLTNYKLSATRKKRNINYINRQKLSYNICFGAWPSTRDKVLACPPVFPSTSRLKLHRKWQPRPKPSPKDNMSISLRTVYAHCESMVESLNWQSLWFPTWWWPDWLVSPGVCWTWKCCKLNRFNSFWPFEMVIAERFWFKCGL